MDFYRVQALLWREICFSYQKNNTIYGRFPYIGRRAFHEDMCCLYTMAQSRWTGFKTLDFYSTW